MTQNDRTKTKILKESKVTDNRGRKQSKEKDNYKYTNVKMGKNNIS